MGQPQGIPIQQIFLTVGTVIAGNTQAATSIAVLGTVASLIPTYMQIVSTNTQVLELHQGTPAATVSTNRICLIPGLSTIASIPIQCPVKFGGISEVISIRNALPTPVTAAGIVIINLWN